MGSYYGNRDRPAEAECPDGWIFGLTVADDVTAREALATVCRVLRVRSLDVCLVAGCWVVLGDGKKPGQWHRRRHGFTAYVLPAARRQGHLGFVERCRKAGGRWVAHRVEGNGNA